MSITEQTSGAADYLAYVDHGDVAALDRALRACAERAYTQARRRLGNAADADDAVQEAFLQLVRSASRFDRSMPFHVWVGLTVKTACLRLLRSDRRWSHFVGRSQKCSVVVADRWPRRSQRGSQGNRGERIAGGARA